MTDINKELLDFQENGYEHAMEQFALQEQETKEKKHMLNAHYVLTSLEKMIDNKDYSKNGVAFISFSNYHDYDIGNIVNFTLLDLNHEPVDKYSSKGDHTYCQEQTKLFLSKLRFDDTLVHPAFKEDKVMEFGLNKNGLAEFKNMLLSDKLKASLNHALLDTQLSNKHENNEDNKKMKI